MSSRWIITGTPSGSPYPCRCIERPRWAKTCSAAWCPCAGRADPPFPECCGTWFTPADVVQAKAIWELQRRYREEMT